MVVPSDQSSYNKGICIEEIGCKIGTRTNLSLLIDTKVGIEDILPIGFNIGIDRELGGP